MPDVKFIHPAGDVLIRNIEVFIEDGAASITGFVSADVWDNIEIEDVFGARTRTRDGSVVGDGDVKITITGPEGAMSPGPYARDWSIVDAQRRLDGAPSDGEVWTGTTFTASHIWSKAAVALDEIGYSLQSSSESSATFSSDDGITVDVEAAPDGRVATLAARAKVGDTTGSARGEVLEFLNALNDRVRLGGFSIAEGTLTGKSSVPMPSGTDVSVVLEALAYGIPGMTTAVADALRPVVAGTSSASDALSQIFG